jgi:hypothetical protein
MMIMHQSGHGGVCDRARCIEVLITAARGTGFLSGMVRLPLVHETTFQETREHLNLQTEVVAVGWVAFPVHGLREPGRHHVGPAARGVPPVPHQTAYSTKLGVCGWSIAFDYRLERLSGRS